MTTGDVAMLCLLFLLLGLFLGFWLSTRME